METTLLPLLLSAVLYTLATSSRYRKYIFTRDMRNWTDAQSYCREKHSDLVTLHSQEEQQKLAEKMCQYKVDNIYIGLSRINSSMKWSNGDDVDYTNYSSESGRMKPYCNTMSANRLWENVNCTELRSFMCYNKGNDGLPRKYSLIKQKMSWCGAQRYCRLHHTDLISVHNDSQNRELRRKGATGAPFWIGLMHAEWEWSDGECSAFRHWHPQQLYNTTGRDCLRLTDSNLWALYNCSETQTAACYEDQIHLIKEKKTWEEALDHCDHKYEGGFLSIQSQEDQRVVEVELKRRNVTSGPVWLGLRQSRLFGFWIWANGLNVGWSNWKGSSQPEQPLSHICGAMVTSRPGRFKWSDKDCLSKSYFLCEGEERKERPPSTFTTMSITSRTPQDTSKALSNPTPQRTTTPSTRPSTPPDQQSNQSTQQPNTTESLPSTFTTTNITSDETPSNSTPQHMTTPNPCPFILTEHSRNTTTRQPITEDQIHLITERKTWEEAREYCNHTCQGRLLRILSQEEQNVVEAKFNSMKGSLNKGPVWMGLRRCFNMTWVWEDGSRVNFSNWHEESQPHDCGALSTGSQRFKWRNRSCNDQRPFLCEGKRKAT